MLSIFSGVLQIVLLILELITAWKVFEKYGEPGWKGIIPFYSDFVEFGKVWSSTVGIVYIIATIIGIIDTKESGLILGLISAIAAIAAFVINIMFAIKKSKAFGCGVGTILLLIFLPFVGNLYIGFSQNIQYIGNQSN